MSIFALKIMFPMVRYVYMMLLMLLPLTGSAQFVYSLSPDVRSPRIELNGQWDAMPVMVLGSDDVMCFSFDEMSHAYHRFTYRITHCNSDWIPSDMHEIEFLEGFNGVPVEEWENSVNTTVLYTHYSFSLPNEDVSLLLSGNYKVEIFDDEAENDIPLAVFCFSVVEPKVGISAMVSGDTDISFNDGHQQLSFVVDYSRWNISSPSSEVKPVVYQNRRPDNVVSGIKPTYITGNSLEYVHNERLVFNAGNEYRRFELTDPDYPGLNVEEVAIYSQEYHALLYMDRPRVTRSSYIDENGRYYVNTLEGYGSPIEADYAYVHFALDVPYRDGGNYYLLGDLCGNSLSPVSVLDYDSDGGYYHTTQLLKLGLYNYMYVWLPHGNSVAQTSVAEGDIFNTENEYLIYIYYRGFGERYDRLVGVHAFRYLFEHN